MSLAESCELSVEDLKKDAVLEMLVNYLVPDDGGARIASKRGAEPPQGHDRRAKVRIPIDVDL